MASHRHNIVKEIRHYNWNGSDYIERHCSPFTRRWLNMQRELVRSFQCDVTSQYDMVDTTDPGIEAHHPPVYCCRFGAEKRTGHLLAMAGEDGNIAVVDTTQRRPDDLVPSSIVHNVHQNAVMDVSWVTGSDELVTGGGDKTAVVWQLRAGRLHPQLKLLGHTGAVKAIAVNQYDPVVFASGSRDTNIIIWDRRCGPNQRADEIVPAHPCLSSAPSPRFGAPTTSTNGVTGLLFSGQHTLVSAGASDGRLKIWDLRRSHCAARGAPLAQYVLHQPQQSGLRGFSWLTAPHRSHYIYALAMDHNIYAYHIANPTQTPVCQYSGAHNLSYYVRCCVSPCGGYLVSGGSDHRALVWLTARPGPPISQLTGHEKEVTAVDWGQWGQQQIVTCSDDSKQKIFRIKRTDPDDLTANLLIRGRAAPVDQEVLDRCPKMTSQSQFMCKGSPSVNKRPLRHPSVPKTPRSTKKPPIIPNNNLGTPSRKKHINSAILSTPHRGGGPSNSDAATPLRVPTDGLSVMPSHEMSPMTPSSIDRSVSLLQWLSSLKKTPRTLDTTPRAQEAALCVSATKKAGIKRKLTEVMLENNEDDHDLENVMDDGTTCHPTNKKTAISPTENILVNISNGDNNQVPTASKMLKYENNELKRTESNIEKLFGISDSIQPFETSMLDTLMDGSFRTSFGESKSSTAVNVEPLNQTKPLLSSYKPCGLPGVSDKVIGIGKKEEATVYKSKFSSPTANLPNFVLDGSSPRVRPTPVFQPQPDWLSTLGKERRQRGSSNNKEAAPARKSISRRTPGIKASGSRNKKKILALVSLVDKKMTQTKLNFQQ